MCAVVLLTLALLSNDLHNTLFSLTVVLMSNKSVEFFSVVSFILLIFSLISAISLKIVAFSAGGLACRVCDVPLAFVGNFKFALSSDDVMVSLQKCVDYPAARQSISDDIDIIHCSTFFKTETLQITKIFAFCTFDFWSIYVITRTIVSVAFVCHFETDSNNNNMENTEQNTKILHTKISIIFIMYG